MNIKRITAAKSKDELEIAVEYLPYDIASHTSRGQNKVVAQLRDFLNSSTAELKRRQGKSPFKK